MHPSVGEEGKSHPYGRQKPLNSIHSRKVGFRRKMTVEKVSCRLCIGLMSVTIYGRSRCEHKL